MTDDRFQRCEELFHSALDLDGAAREEFLQAACAADVTPSSRGRAPAEGPRPSGRLHRVSGRGSASSWADAAEPWTGRRIGPYSVVRELGRGGMGAVYLAERADGQYQQRVALKLIKRGMDSEQVLARFRAERQILASLDHPNIARLLDGGSTEQGLPFFAMEYIEGEPIDTYASRAELSVEDRLRLFLQVCGAVAYAHQHLVIHRDIKPLNILVTSEGMPKLLDFGIAKVLQAGDEETSTVTGMRLLTPEYASPEQVEGRHATTVSDVYALGVVLYELLTGRSPYRLRSRTPTGCGARPSAPPIRSVRARPATTRRCAGAFEGDLDTILLTALRKEPDRRYQSVEQLRRRLATPPGRDAGPGPAGHLRLPRGQVRAAQPGSGGGGGPRRARPGGRDDRHRLPGAPGPGGPGPRRAPLRGRAQARAHRPLRLSRRDQGPARRAPGARAPGARRAWLPRRTGAGSGGRPLAAARAGRRVPPGGRPASQRSLRRGHRRRRSQLRQGVGDLGSPAPRGQHSRGTARRRGGRAGARRGGMGTGKPRRGARPGPARPRLCSSPSSPPLRTIPICDCSSAPRPTGWARSRWSRARSTAPWRTIGPICASSRRRRRPRSSGPTCAKPSRCPTATWRTPSRRRGT